MIVRILTEGQYNLPSEYLDELNTIDNQIVDLVAKNSRSEFGSMIASMLNLVREKGTPVPIDEMVE